MNFNLPGWSYNELPVAAVAALYKYSPTQDLLIPKGLKQHQEYAWHRHNIEDLANLVRMGPHRLEHFERLKENFDLIRPATPYDLRRRSDYLNPSSPELGNHYFPGPEEREEHIYLHAQDEQQPSLQIKPEYNVLSSGGPGDGEVFPAGSWLNGHYWLAQGAVDPNHFGRVHPLEQDSGLICHPLASLLHSYHYPHSPAASPINWGPFSEERAQFRPSPPETPSRWSKMGCVSVQSDEQQGRDTMSVDNYMDDFEDGEPHAVDPYGELEDKDASEVRLLLKDNKSNEEESTNKRKLSEENKGSKTTDWKGEPFHFPLKKRPRMFQMAYPIGHGINMAAIPTLSFTFEEEFTVMDYVVRIEEYQNCRFDFLMKNFEQYSEYLVSFVRCALLDHKIPYSREIEKTLFMLGLEFTKSHTSTIFKEMGALSTGVRRTILNSTYFALYVVFFSILEGNTREQRLKDQHRKTLHITQRLHDAVGDKVSEMKSARSISIKVGCLFCGCLFCNLTKLQIGNFMATP